MFVVPVDEVADEVELVVELVAVDDVVEEDVELVVDVELEGCVL